MKDNEGDDEGEKQLEPFVKETGEFQISRA
jgi:hypothetical protein